ncbi:hypothetical protein QYM36_016505 [Artemia franciscana]|uniref:Uncharacterized protein n=1 Tax=Artemia franciscana TaxID=6661 RepID=A0AA88HA30_ARTSF|nr:hypothetical protein QYM36_016505 [Artemia franciscana]
MIDLNYNAAVAIIKKRKAEMQSPFLNLLILFVDSNVEYAVIELLLKAGANPKYCFQVPTYETELKQKKFFFFKQVWGQTPLHIAVRNGRIDLCDLLISYGATVDGMNLKNETPLVTAIKANNPEMVKYLLESGANPNCSQCLHHAVSEAKENLCQLLISYGANVDAINMKCETPLVTAILNNNSDMVKYLLESGANPNCAQYHFGILHVAVWRRRANLCQLLISYDAKVDALNANNTTPLVMAIQANDLDMVRYLLESGADPNCAQCMHHAAREGRADLCRLLFSYGADLNAMDANNETPLMLAIKGTSQLSRLSRLLKDSLDTVKYLIYQQIQCNVNVYSESLLMVLSMVNRCLSDRPFAQCKTLKDACRQAIIQQKQDTDLSRVYKCMKSLDIPRCLVSYLFYEEQLNFLLTLSPEKFLDLLKETDRKNLKDDSLSKRKSDEIGFEGVQSKRRKH